MKKYYSFLILLLVATMAFGDQQVGSNLDLNGNQIKNADIDGGTASNSNRLTTPKNTKTNLDSLTRKEGTIVYATDQAKLFVDNGSTLTPVGSGSGSGAVNFLETSSKAADFETDITGYSAYKDAAATTPVDGTGGTSTLTLSRNTTTPLKGLADLKIAKPASNVQGEGFSVDVTVPRGYVGARVGEIKFLWDGSAASATGDWKVFVYDVTNTTMITPINPILSSSSLPNRKEPVSLSWAGSATGDTYRLIFHHTTTGTGAYNIFLDDIVFGPGPAPSVGAVVTAPITFTPSFTNQGTATFTVNQSEYWRVGDKMHMRLRLVRGTGGSGSTAFRIALPNNLTAALTPTTIESDYGSWSYYSSSTFDAGGTITVHSGYKDIILIDNGTGDGLTGANIPAYLYIHAKDIPIAEWSGGGTQYQVNPVISSPSRAGFIQYTAEDASAWPTVNGMKVKNGWAVADGTAINQADYPDLYANIGTTWDQKRNQSTGSNYSAPSAGTFRIPDLRGVFQRGVGTSSGYDATTLGTTQDDATAKNGLTATSANTDLSHTHNFYPINRDVSASVTNNGNAYVSDNSKSNSQATSGASISMNHSHTITVGNGDTETRPVNTGLYAIVKLWNDSTPAAVGFLNASATNPGLVSGGTVPGIANGSSVASGYIGEVISGTLSSGSNNSTSPTLWANTITLTPGIWEIVFYDASYRSGIPGSGQSASARARIWCSTDSAEIATSSWYHYISNTTNDYESNYAAQFYISVVVNISTTKQYIGQGLLSLIQGAVTNRAEGKFYAKRIG